MAISFIIFHYRKIMIFTDRAVEIHLGVQHIDKSSVSISQSFTCGQFEKTGWCWIKTWDAIDFCTCQSEKFFSSKRSHMTSQTNANQMNSGSSDWNNYHMCSFAPQKNSKPQSKFRICVYLRLRRSTKNFPKPSPAYWAFVQAKK